MSTGPDDPAAAGRGHLRASHADREHVIAVLKTAFVQDRLTKDEFDHRVGQVLASRTYAELAALTADLPTESPSAAAAPAVALPAVALPAAASAVALPAVASAAVAPGALASATSPDPVSAAHPGRTLAIVARRSGICALITVVLVQGAILSDSFGLLCLALFSFIATMAFLGYGFVDAREERRLPHSTSPSPGPSRNGPDGGQPGPIIPTCPHPDPRTDPTRTDANHTDSRAPTPRAPTCAPAAGAPTGRFAPAS